MWYSQSHWALNGKMYAVPGLGPGSSNMPTEHLTKSHSYDQNWKGLDLDGISGTPVSLRNKETKKQKSYTAPVAAWAPRGHELPTFKGHAAHTMTIPAGTGHHLTRSHVSATRLSDHTVCPLHAFFLWVMRAPALFSWPSAVWVAGKPSGCQQNGSQ